MCVCFFNRNYCLNFPSLMFSSPLYCFHHFYPLYTFGLCLWNMFYRYEMANRQSITHPWNTISFLFQNKTWNLSISDVYKKYRMNSQSCNQSCMHLSLTETFIWSLVKLIWCAHEIVVFIVFYSYTKYSVIDIWIQLMNTINHHAANSHCFKWSDATTSI